MFLDFAKDFGLVIDNSSFPKKENHLVTFHSTVAKTRIDLLLRKCDRSLCKNYKVILSEYPTTQHKLSAKDLEIKRKRTLYDLSRIKWGGLTTVEVQEMREKLLARGLE